jgi:hypothetical protein
VLLTKIHTSIPEFSKDKIRPDRLIRTCSCGKEFSSIEREKKLGDETESGCIYNMDVQHF